jgi:hypothetical protein
MTEICDRVRKGGPALFRAPRLAYGAGQSPARRGAMLRMGEESVDARGKLLAFLKEPEPPKAEGRLAEHAPRVHAACTWREGALVGAVPEIVGGRDVDLGRLRCRRAGQRRRAADHGASR